MGEASPAPRRVVAGRLLLEGKARTKQAAMLAAGYTPATARSNSPNTSQLVRAADARPRNGKDLRSRAQSALETVLDDPSHPHYAAVATAILKQQPEQEQQRGPSFDDELLHRRICLQLLLNGLRLAQRLDPPALAALIDRYAAAAAQPLDWRLVLKAQAVEAEVVDHG